MLNDNNDRGSGFGSFFRYHGWLSPGVRLFRSINFPLKAAWISVMFLIPLSTMMWFLWSAANEQIVTARSELQGLDYVNRVTDLISAAQEQRRAAIAKAADLADTQSKVAAAFSQVQAVEKELGKAFSSSAGFAAMEKAYRALPAASANPDETYAQYTAFIDANLDLLSRVADGSQLSLDPELETYHLMNLSVVLGPQEQEYLARLRGLGNITLQTKQSPPERVLALRKALTLIEYLDAGYENSFKLGIESDPEFAKTIDMKGADEIRDAFLAAVNKQVLIDQPAGDSAAFLALGNKAVSSQQVMNRKVADRLRDLLQARVSRVQNHFAFELGMSVFFVLLALYLMLAFYKVMMGGLKEVAGHLSEITQGNLTTAPKPWGNDEAAQLMITMGEMQTSLRRIASIVLDSASSVQTASEEIASASQDLSRRTESNAASLEQTAASMEQITATVKHTSDTVTGAGEIVRENASSATRGGAVIAQVVSTMEGIRSSSNQIGEIIGVIDSIAFQTNILALNAAVEAARAGEQGRGFAVVAAEVRALAGRSATAAKEIKNLISASISQVESGNRVVAEAGTTIQAIVNNANRIDALMTEIATATREQTTGLAQVGVAVHELDQGTQQNAALVEETAAASTALADQAQRLADEVAFFKLK